ncbi:MAG: hypothetical protein CMI18_08785, partial [Opitutaceae bacterium]|nr:hypothetical protein [Opitutaceae bacterium]
YDFGAVCGGAAYLMYRAELTRQLVGASTNGNKSDSQRRRVKFKASEQYIFIPTLDSIGEPLSSGLL